MAMTRSEMEAEVDRILFKRDKGESLTKTELRILQYSKSPCRCTCSSYVVYPR